MRLLLDTHIFLWALSGDSRLKSAARLLMESADEIHVSAATLWEVSIKARIGKIDADVDELHRSIDASGFLELPVRGVHAAAVARLPPHHSDPFDRLLVAQALVEPLRLLSADPLLARYTDLVILA